MEVKTKKNEKKNIEEKKIVKIIGENFKKWKIIFINELKLVNKKKKNCRGRVQKRKEEMKNTKKQMKNFWKINFKRNEKVRIWKKYKVKWRKRKIDTKLIKKIDKIIETKVLIIISFYKLFSLENFSILLFLLIFPFPCFTWIFWNSYF